MSCHGNIGFWMNLLEKGYARDRVQIVVSTTQTPFLHPPDCQEKTGCYSQRLVMLAASSTINKHTAHLCLVVNALAAWTKMFLIPGIWNRTFCCEEGKHFALALKNFDRAGFERLEWFSFTRTKCRRTDVPRLLSLLGCISRMGHYLLFIFNVVNYILFSLLALRRCCRVCLRGGGSVTLRV